MLCLLWIVWTHFGLEYAHYGLCTMNENPLRQICSLDCPLKSYRWLLRQRSHRMWLTAVMTVAVISSSDCYCDVLPPHQEKIQLRLQHHQVLKGGRTPSRVPCCLSEHVLNSFLKSCSRCCSLTSCCNSVCMCTHMTSAGSYVCDLNLSTRQQRAAAAVISRQRNREELTRETEIK